MNLSQLLERHVDRMDELDRWRTDPTIYVSFTQLLKIGINPHTEYKTPLGIYAYPLREMYQKIEDNDIPHAGEQPYIQVLQSDQVTELSSYSEGDLVRDVAKLKTRFGMTVRLSVMAERDLWDEMTSPKVASQPYSEYARHQHELHIALMTKMQQMQADGTAFDLMIKEWSKNAEPNQLAGSRMWNITRNIALQLAKLKSYHASFPVPGVVAWNSILRWLGYQAFSDKTGMGLIHENEPISAVFLSKAAFRHLRTITNVRKYEEPVSVIRLSDLLVFLASSPPWASMEKGFWRRRSLLMKEWPKLVDDGSSEHFQFSYQFADDAKEKLAKDFVPFIQALLTADFNGQLPLIAQVLRRNDFFHSVDVITAFLNITPTSKQLPVYLEVMLGEQWIAYDAAYELTAIEGEYRPQMTKRSVGKAILSRVANGEQKDTLSHTQWFHLQMLLDAKPGQESA